MNQKASGNTIKQIWFSNTQIFREKDKYGTCLILPWFLCRVSTYGEWHSLGGQETKG